MVLDVVLVVDGVFDLGGRELGQELGPDVVPVVEVLLAAVTSLVGLRGGSGWPRVCLFRLGDWRRVALFFVLVAWRQIAGRGLRHFPGQKP